MKALKRCCARSMRVNASLASSTLETRRKRNACASSPIVASNTDNHSITRGTR